MNERVHFRAHDGRTFTFAEWVEYLKDHDTGDVYRTVEGFDFNVHGACLNPHVITINPKKRLNGILCYYEIRTYRREVNLVNRNIVWWYDVFSMNCGAHAYGPTNPGDTEEDAIRKALEVSAESIKKHIAWYERSIKADIEAWGHPTMGYGSDLARDRRMLDLTREEYDNRIQLTLF